MNEGIKYGYFRAYSNRDANKPTYITVAFRESKNKTLPTGISGKCFDVAFTFCEPIHWGYNDCGEWVKLGDIFNKKTGRSAARGRLLKGKGHSFYVSELDCDETFLTLWSLFESAINAEGVEFPESVRRAYKRDKIRFGLNTARDVAEDQ
jgi:hypothetical protein